MIEKGVSGYIMIIILLLDRNKETEEHDFHIKRTRNIFGIVLQQAIFYVFFKYIVRVPFVLTTA